ncbi:MAG: hypothetical protein JSV83_02615 [Desulfobacterales bacterium]|nr:MAG: hypothetical protein JSV83_02615 [Desulfobacterales bacterium]
MISYLIAITEFFKVFEKSVDININIEGKTNADTPANRITGRGNIDSGFWNFGDELFSFIDFFTHLEQIN